MVREPGPSLPAPLGAVRAGCWQVRPAGACADTGLGGGAGRAGNSHVPVASPECSRGRRSPTVTSRVGGRSVRNQPPSPRGQRRPDPGSAGSVGTSSAGSVCAGALAIPDSLARRGAGLREACQGSQRSADSGRSVAVGSEEAGAAATRAPDDEAASPAPDDGAEEVAVTQAPDDDGADGAAVTRAPEGGAEDAGAGPQASDGGTDGHDPQLSPRGPGCQGNCSRHDGEGGPGSKGAVVEGACAPPLAERAPRALAPGGDAAPAAAAVTSSGLLELLTVSFRSPLEAEMARRALTTHVQRHRGLAQKELCVRGSALAVRWTTEDPICFRVSVNSFLDRLPLVIRNIRALGSRPPRRLGPGKGAEA
ncbi:collagen alpha-1(I) chain-like [Felis catus]|uniref:collagen alpha-1(I) chain-like n=1 Tax=Felis catus TaxID=9685 RepID=UPI001D1A30E4|nr:collagen alpha-1(I) chain-like [Felis catus]XP_044906341.1 collagen alpha-1(I) chain-like [Felis catus]XP_044906343.1 collagen alpha-1(I) chain-like [Felis catus]XP_044907622.1 collagen alpha-1(I) chain-like [Felis catus]